LKSLSELKLSLPTASPELSSAEERYLDSKTDDQKKLTELKESYAGAVMIFLWFWFGALILLILTYVSHLIATDKEIPKEVIIAAFTCTAVVVGLVGYILKGLFGSKE
jgi:hypothetical protein